MCWHWLQPHPKVGQQVRLTLLSLSIQCHSGACATDVRGQQLLWVFNSHGAWITVEIALWLLSHIGAVAYIPFYFSKTCFVTQHL